MTESEQATNTTPVKVLLETNLGPIKLALWPDKAPQTVANFVQYVEEGFYEGTQFHRVIDGFMIQGGGFTTDFQQKPTRPSIQNEADNGQSNRTGTVAMARTPDPHSATAQFFINVSDNTFLDFTSADSNGYGYAVFGEVIEGMETVDKIRSVQTGPGGPMPQDVPQQPVIIESARVIAADS